MILRKENFIKVLKQTLNRYCASYSPLSLHTFPLHFTFTLFRSPADILFITINHEISRHIVYISISICKAYPPSLRPIFRHGSLMTIPCLQILMAIPCLQILRWIPGYGPLLMNYRKMWVICLLKFLLNNDSLLILYLILSYADDPLMSFYLFF